jgi:hypothetical protein
MRSVDLALYSDALAGRASLLASELERARARLRQGMLESEARAALGEAVIERLDQIGVLGHFDPAAQREEIAGLAASLRALEELQAWVEGRLFALREEGLALTE